MTESWESAARRALDLVLAERASQEAKWGVQRISWPEWMTVLMEEVGEAAQVANEVHWRGDRQSLTLDDLRDELVQVAAVAVAMIEHIEEVGEAGT